MNPDDPPSAWTEQRGLVSLGRDAWRIKDACEGTVIFGGTGSGKTSGSGRTLALSFLGAGFGGLVLCAKPEEPALWRGYAEEAGRKADLIMFGGNEPWGFNFMHYESQRCGAAAGLTENLVNLFMEVSSIGSGDGRTRGGDPFWERAMRSLIRNCVDVLVMAGEPVSLHAMFDVIRSAPSDPSSPASIEWRARSSCWHRLETARQRALGSTWEVDCREVAGYWLGHFPTLGDKTRGSIVAMFATLAEALMRGKMRELFCEGTTLCPEDVIGGRVVPIPWTSLRTIISGDVSRLPIRLIFADRRSGVSLSTAFYCHAYVSWINHSRFRRQAVLPFSRSPCQISSGANERPPKVQRVAWQVGSL